MAQAQLIPPALVTPPRPAPARREASSFRFTSLVLTEPHSLAKARGATFSVSIAVHLLLLMAVVMVPLFYEDVLPMPSDAVRAFFVGPPQVAPPPPPPPPPVAGARVVAKAPVAQPPPDAGRFTAPIEVPTLIPEEESISLGIEGGVPGGVEGGVPGGVVGGIVGGLPSEAAAAPVKVVRVGGHLKAPKLIHRVDPEYPPLAQAARLQALIILEARVGVNGRVVSAQVLRGQALFDEAALAAVKQWRYMPLLLNGEPSEFILTVTVNFSLKTVEQPQ